MAAIASAKRALIKHNLTTVYNNLIVSKQMRAEKAYV